jgi:hypothetical protein
VLHRKAKPRARGRWALAAFAVALVGCVLTQSAMAAAPTPESATQCGGVLTRAKPTSLDPNLINYAFSCDWGVSSYTLIVNRTPDNGSSIDDFNTNPLVYDTSGNPLSTTALSCSGTIPGDGINCNAGAGGYVAAPDTAKGSIDTTDPYCPYLPPGAPAGTKPQPGAVVQLIVTDTTGAEDGPFRLRLAGKCPKPKATPLPKTKTKTKPKSTTGHQTAARA